MSKLTRSRNKRVWWAVALAFGLFITPGTAFAQNDTPDPTPYDCAGCHEEAYHAWQDSTHANSLTDPTFLEAWTRANEPEYCKTCHATGYDPADGTVSYEGVGCLFCHEDETGTHPTGNMTVDKSSELCGKCHTGTHAPDYDQWLMSEHATMNIGCNDCHQSHSYEIHMETPSELCLNCHAFKTEDIHGEQGMECNDCHMFSSGDVIDLLSQRASGPGHTFGITAEVCSSCHGMTHTLAPDGTDVSTSAAEEYAEELETEVSELEEQSQQRFDLGLTGGGIGGLVLGITIPWLLRKRRVK